MDLESLNLSGRALLDAARALYRHRRAQERRKIQSPQEAMQVLMPLLGEELQEVFVEILLDTRLHVLSVEELYRGTVNQVAMRVAEVFRPAIVANAPNILLAHNHPSGDPSPSPEDLAITREVVQAGRLLHIHVLDHLIIGGDRFVSLRAQCPELFDASPVPYALTCV